MNHRERVMAWALAKIDDPRSLINEADRDHLIRWVSEMSDYEVRQRSIALDFRKGESWA